MKLTMINALLMSTLMRMEMLRSMDTRVTLKVNLCLKPGASSHKIISSPRENMHTPVSAQKNRRRPMISPQTSMSLTHTHRAPITLWCTMAEDTETTKSTRTTTIPETIFKWVEFYVRSIWQSRLPKYQHSYWWFIAVIVALLKALRAC